VFCDIHRKQHSYQNVKTHQCGQVPCGCLLRYGLCVASARVQPNTTRRAFTAATGAPDPSLSLSETVGCASKRWLHEANFLRSSHDASCRKDVLTFLCAVFDRFLWTAAASAHLLLSPERSNNWKTKNHLLFCIPLVFLTSPTTNSHFHFVWKAPVPVKAVTSLLLCSWLHSSVWSLQSLLLLFFLSL
jgi:hypothetical protein